MNKLERDMARARTFVDRPWSDGWEERMERAIPKRRRAKQRRRAVTVAAALLICAGAVGFLRPQPQPTLRFADGSTAQPYSRATELETALATPERIVVLLKRGGAHFEVTPHPERSFRVEAGEVRVEVIGTAFDVDWSESRVRVHVDHGRVRVRSGSQEQFLGAGQSVDLPAHPDELAAAQPSIAPLPQPEPESLAVEPAPVPEPARVGPAPRPAVRRRNPWKTLAEKGDYDGAWKQLSRSSDPVSDLPEELLSAADVARLSHHPAAAVPLLQKLINEHPRDPRASLAAFTLGRVLLDELGRPQDAAAAFARVRRLDASSPLAPDALAREVEAWSVAGDASRARERADEYSRKYPKGERLPAVRKFGGQE
jgi:transmembrane sensor